MNNKQIIRNLKSWDECNLESWKFGKSKIYCSAKSTSGFCGYDIGCIADDGKTLSPIFGYHEFNGEKLKENGLSNSQRKMINSILCFVSINHYVI